MEKIITQLTTHSKLVCYNTFGWKVWLSSGWLVDIWVDRVISFVLNIGGEGGGDCDGF